MVIPSRVVGPTESINYFETNDAETLIRELPGYDPYVQAGNAVFDRQEASRTIELFHCLTHEKAEWAGQLLFLTRWEQAWIGNLFGWKRPDGSRRYRTAFLAIPRKNGKSTLAAGLAIRLFHGEREPGAEIISAASTREQARFVWDLVRRMIRRNQVLAARTRFYQHSLVLRDDDLSNYKPVAAEAGPIYGANLHGAIIDELHQLPTRDLVDAIKTSTGARRQPLVVEITTAGWDIESICYKEWEYARMVRDNVIHDPEFLPCIYETPADAPWDQPDTWRAYNPNFGISIKADWLTAECHRCKGSPARENAFRRLHLNQWVGAASPWLTLESWRACDGTFDIEAMKGRPCFGGLDLGRTDSLAAFALCFANNDGTYRVAVWHFMPNKDIRHREEIDRASYTAWAAAGLLELTGKNATDYNAILRRIEWAAKTFKLQVLAYDRWDATELIAKVQNEIGVKCEKVGQGFASMKGPVKEVERLVLDKQLSYNRNPMLDWQINHCSVCTDPAGNRKPDKESSRSFIDGIVAMVMAIGCAVLSKQTIAPVRIREVRW